MLAIGAEANGYFRSIGVYDFSNHDSYERDADKTELRWGWPWAPCRLRLLLAPQRELGED